VYTLTLTVRDDDGGVTTATTQVTVYNAPPEVFVTDGGAYEGSLFTSSGTFTDPGSDTWTAMVDYGDGTGWQPLELDGQSFTLAHVYPNDGQYLLRVAVMDDGGEVGVGYASITIFNVAPTVAITGGTANEGSVSNISATIIDPGQEDSWWVLINYGDGTYSEWRTVNNRDFTLNHVYADNGTYTVTFQVWDDDGSGSATAQVVVHNVAPTVTVTGGTTNEGSSITLIGTHDDPGRLDRAVLAHVDYGDGSPVQTFVPYWWGSYALSHTYADNGTYQVTLSVIDDDGGVGTATSTVVVNNVAPSVYLEDSWYGFGEGTPATLRGGFYDPGQQDTWTATVNYGDGTGEQPLALTSSFITLSHVYANNGAYTVTLTVRDDDGGVGTVTRQVNVYNAPPVVSASGGIINEGSTFTSLGSFTDPGADTWTARVNYGDGTGWQPLALNGKSFALEHVYGNDGNYYVQIVVRDSDGAEGSAWAYVTVRNVAPVVTATGGTGNEGSAITISGTITDPGQESFWTAWIDYGDGTSAGYYLTSRSFTVNHVYADNRTYTVTIRVSDSFWGDSEGRTTTQVVVHNVAPTVTATGDTGYEGASITLRASYTDPGSLDTAVARINYGDGSPVETISLRSWERSFTMSHRYADNGIYLVTVSVIDDDGGVGTATVPMEVRNVTPALQPVVSCSPNEGALCAISGEFLDPGADSWTVTVNFGDGSAAQEISLGVGSSRAYAASHVYDDNGLYMVAVTVMDDDGGRSTSTHLVQVRNVAPTATASNDSPQYWGVPVTLVGTATDPSQADTQAGFTALWTLGDDTTASELTTAHTYAAPGTYAALLSVTDKDGGTNTIPVMTTVTIRKRPGAVTCQDTTVTFGFPAALGARFMDGLAGGLTGGRSLSFRLGGSTGLGSATTDATGRASVQSPGDLVPGSYPVTVSFAEDSHYTATEATCTLTVTESHGTIIGGGLRLSNNSRGGFNVRREEGGSVQGELQFQSDSTSFHAHELTALGISADHRQGWFAGVGRDGRSFTAYVEDNGEPGNADVFRLWIDGVLQTGDGNGTISGGNIQFHDHRS
jgi:PKD repeat protein